MATLLNSQEFICELRRYYFIIFAATACKSLCNEVIKDMKALHILYYKILIVPLILKKGILHFMVIVTIYVYGSVRNDREHSNGLFLAEN